MCLSSSLDRIDVHVELLADDVWEFDDDKPYLLSVGVDSYNQLFFYRQPMSFTIVKNSNEIENMINENKRERWTNRKKWKYQFYEWSEYLFDENPCENNRSWRMWKINLMDIRINFFGGTPVYSRNIFSSLNTERSLDQ